MCTVSCYVAIVLVGSTLGAAPASSNREWRKRAIDSSQLADMPLHQLVEVLSHQSKIPIHLVCETRLCREPIARPVLKHERPTLGHVFDWVAERVPELLAIPTRRGVLWTVVSEPSLAAVLDEAIDLPMISGNVADLMSAIFDLRVHSVGTIVLPPFHDPYKIRIDHEGFVKVRTIDGLVDVVESNDCCISLHVSVNHDSTERTVRNSGISITYYARSYR